MYCLIAAVWGFCSMTWFFLSPAVGLSFMALKGWRPLLWAFLCTLLGGIIGAFVLYRLFDANPAYQENMLAYWKTLPISPMGSLIYQAYAQNLPWPAGVLAVPLQAFIYLLPGPLLVLLLSKPARKKLTATQAHWMLPLAIAVIWISYWLWSIWINLPT